MNKSRLEAFSDGVIAIIITIMVLEFKIPNGNTWIDIKPLLPLFVNYALSFLYIGIYWNNHHHLLHTVKRINGFMMWANLHLLFWLSLIPFVTAWTAQQNFAPFPNMCYGLILLMCAISYFILQKQIIKNHGKNSLLHKAIGNDIKGKVSLILYTIGIATSFWNKWFTGALYLLVALMWLVPDKRIESVFEHENKH